MQADLEEKVNIPAKGRFKFLSANRISEPENGIQVVFTEPVSDTQDLNGLISLSGVSSYILQVNDNKVNAYFEAANSGTVTLTVNENVKSMGEVVLGSPSSVSFSQQSYQPRVEISSSGTNMPDSKHLLIPFRAVSLYPVDLEVIRLFERHSLTFMQLKSRSS